MVGSSAPGAAVPQAEATKQRKREKTREEKDAHNMRLEQLEKMEIEHLEMVPKFNQTRSENERMQAELEAQNSKIRSMEKENQELRITLENQGRHFSSCEEAVKCFASQTYDLEQLVQGAGTGYANMADFGDDSFIANAMPFGLDTSINHYLTDDLFLRDFAAVNLGGLANSGAGSSGANYGLDIDAHAHNSTDQFTPDDVPAAGSEPEETPSSKAVL